MKPNEPLPPDLENRVRARLILLIAWTGSVAVVIWLGVGFGGGIDQVFTADNPLAWGISASPLIPLLLWIIAFRRQKRR